MTAKFYITASKNTINEGDTVTFSVRASGVAPGLNIPYNILGIQSEDLTSGQLSGNLFMLPDSLPYSSQANLTLGVLEDRVTESFETIVLLVSPQFPYSIEVSSTVGVLDTSIDTLPRYFLSVDKTRIIEGEEGVTVTLSTLNIPNGTVVPYSIIASSKSDITIADFVGLSSLSGNFPPLSSNVANIYLEARDDFLYEPSEYFFVTIPLPGVTTSSQVVEIIDSGNTLLVSDATFTGNIEINFLDPANLRVVLGGTSKGKSDWEDLVGKLSETIYLQGRTPYASDESPVFYQPFSYVVRSTRSIEEWRDSIKRVLHPAGMVVFSEINNETPPDEVNSIELKASLGSEIRDFFTITADNARPPFYTSNNIYKNTKVNVTITSDFTYTIFSYL